ncbi:hypothetical protein NLG97_g9452 [Lecanicillium saksenae]|uniref:Uncharacterized protein n=1 Tax=Lecanicillium saksenae TaxID=468837 RepID=A0ACC1QHT4_9HYPO|nr:hypothetical protein NLG97_g9452 [Lecanicillium saksenae]
MMASSVWPNEPLTRFAFSPAAQHVLMSNTDRISLEPIGSLEKLPSEIILQILDQLDLQSLSRFSQVSFKAWRLVRGFQPYREILKHAPQFPHTLSATKLLKKYSALHIYSHIIASDRCSSCLCFGVFVFLPTCQRVCRPCFLEKIDFKMITKDSAKQAFNLNDEQIASTAFYYSAVHEAAFVSFREGQEMAIRSRHRIFREFELAVEKLYTNFFSTTVNSSAVHVPFPSEDGPDGGYHCTGCVALSGLALVNTFSPQQVHAIHSMSNKQAMERGLRIYAKSEIMAHVQQCSGVEFLLKREK